MTVQGLLSLLLTLFLAIQAIAVCSLPQILNSQTNPLH